MNPSFSPIPRTPKSHWLGVSSVLCLAIAWCVIAPSATAQADDRRGSRPTSEYDILAQNLQRKIGIYQWGGGRVGALVVDLDHEVTVLAREPRRTFPPGQVLKLYTLSAALAQLGPEFQFKTELLYHGELKKKKLHGSLIVRGGGDPTITTYGGEDPKAIDRFLLRWVKALKKAKIRKIEGDIWMDDEAFLREPFAAGWPLDYLGEPWLPEVSAINLNDNCLDILWRKGSKRGRPARMKIRPDVGDTVLLSNNVRIDSTRRDARSYRRREDSNLIDVGGFIHEKTRPIDRAGIGEPPIIFGEILRAKLEDKGIEVGGEVGYWSDADPYVRASERIHSVDVYFSPPLRDHAARVLEPQRNLDAEVLFKELGRRYSGKPGSFSEGANAVTDFMKSIGIRSSGVVFADGSGLSRFDRVSPEQTMAILRAAKKKGWGEILFASIPQTELAKPVEMDPDADELPGAQPEPVVRAIFGQSAGAASAAGWVVNLSGHPVYFALFVGGSTLPGSSLASQLDFLIREIASSTF